MVVLSLLRGTQQQSLKHILTKSFRQPGGSVCKNPGQLGNVVRSMGHERKMVVVPSKYEWTLWKDHIHFYLCLGLVPIGLIVTYVNLFYGQSELRELPRRYQPRHWEYHKHPIQRWFARYCYNDPVEEYERNLHVVFVEAEKAKYRLLEKKVKHMMGQRGDAKGWYYIPINDRRIYVAREEDDREQASDGRRA